MDDFLKIDKIQNHKLLSQRVYTILKTAIIQGDLDEGFKLTEAKVAKELGVSKTPVREALRQLADEEFVRITPNQGVVVNKILIEDIEEFLQIRMALEGLAANLAAKRISKKEIKELEEYNKQMYKFAIKKDLLAFGKENAKFHNLLLHASGNKRLTRIVSNFTDIAYRFWLKSLNEPEKYKNSLEEHSNILTALKKRDPEEAEQLVRIHLNNALKMILNSAGELEDTEINKKT
jgi:DNA-binding GntR family transcriptional regulator